MKKSLLSLALAAFSLSAFAADTDQSGVYFSEDFEWLAPWAEVGNGKACGQTVETDNPSANAPQLATPVVNEVSAYDALLEKGYTFLATHVASKGEREPQAQTYLQTNYLKFGLTGYYSGFTFPITADIPADKATVLKFDWCAMRQGSGVWDPTELVIIVSYNGTNTNYTMDAWNFEDGAKYAWVNHTTEIPAGAIGKGATITIRNTDSQWPDEKGRALRWFIDNITLSDASPAAIEDVTSDEIADENAPVEYYNIQGVRVNNDNLPAGLYIRRQGSKATKVMVR